MRIWLLADTCAQLQCSENALSRQTLKALFGLSPLNVGNKGVLSTQSNYFTNMNPHIWTEPARPKCFGQTPGDRYTDPATGVQRARMQYIDHRAGTAVGLAGFCSGFVTLEQYFNSEQFQPLEFWSGQEPGYAYSCSHEDDATGADASNEAAAIKVYFRNTCSEGLVCSTKDSLDGVGNSQTTVARCIIDTDQEGPSSDGDARTVTPVVVLPALSDILVSRVTSDSFEQAVKTAIGELPLFTNFLAPFTDYNVSAITNLMTGAPDQTFLFENPTAFTVSIRVPESMYPDAVVIQGQTGVQSVPKDHPIFSINDAFALSKIVETVLIKQHAAKTVFEIHFPGFENLGMYSQRLQLDLDVNSKAAVDSTYPNADDVDLEVEDCVALVTALGFTMGQRGVVEPTCYDHDWVRKSVIAGLEAVPDIGSKLNGLVGYVANSLTQPLIQINYNAPPESSPNHHIEHSMDTYAPNMPNRNADAAVATVVVYGLPPTDDTIDVDAVNADALKAYFHNGEDCGFDDDGSVQCSIKDPRKWHFMSSGFNEDIASASSICASLNQDCAGPPNGLSGSRMMTKGCGKGLVCASEYYGVPEKYDHEVFQPGTTFSCMPECTAVCTCEVDGKPECDAYRDLDYCQGRNRNRMEADDDSGSVPLDSGGGIAGIATGDQGSNVTTSTVTTPPATTPSAIQTICAQECSQHIDPATLEQQGDMFQSEQKQVFCVDAPEGVEKTVLAARTPCTLSMKLFLPVVVSATPLTMSTATFAEEVVLTAFGTDEVSPHFGNPRVLVGNASFPIVVFPNSYGNVDHPWVAVSITTDPDDGSASHTDFFAGIVKRVRQNAVAYFETTSTTTTSSSTSTKKKARFGGVQISLAGSGGNPTFQGNLSAASVTEDSTAAETEAIITAVSKALEDVVLDLAENPLGKLDAEEVEADIGVLIEAVDVLVSALVAQSKGDDDSTTTASSVVEAKRTRSTTVNEIAALYAASLPVGTNVTSKGTYVSMILIGADVLQSVTIDEGTLDLGVRVTIPPFNSFEGNPKHNTNTNTNDAAADAADADAASSAGIAMVLVNDTSFFDEVDNETSAAATSSSATGTAAMAAQMPTSSVLSIKLGSGSKIGTKFLNSEKIVFSLPTEKLPEDRDAAEQRCGFYVPLDPTVSLYPDDLGQWISTGCTTTESVGGTTTCECDHLTSFAVLIDTSNSAVDLKALDVVSLVGAVFSAVCLAIIVLLYTCFEGARTTAKKVLLGLSSTLLVAMVMFVVAQQPEAGTTGCIGAAAVLHYALLSAFCWMLCEGIQLYLDFVVLLGSKSHVKKMAAFSAIVPLVAVVANLGVSPDLYGDKSGICWIQDDAAFWASFAGPAFAIMFTNLVIFVFVMRNIFGMESASLKTQAKRGVLASAMFFVLMGVAWIPVLVLYSENEKVDVAIHYLFAVLNAFSGVWLFYLHCAKDEKLRALVSRRFGNGGSSSLSFGKKRLITSGGRANTGAAGTTGTAGQSGDGSVGIVMGMPKDGTFIPMDHSNGASGDSIAVQEEEDTQEQGEAGGGTLVVAETVLNASLSQRRLSTVSIPLEEDRETGGTRVIKRTKSEV